LTRRFDVSQPPDRAYGPAREEDECGMAVDTGLDNTGQDSSDWSAPGPDRDSPGGKESRARVAPDLPDPRKLAQDWITLWQSELSAIAADPEMRESWQTVMALWAGAMSAMLRAMPRAPGMGGPGMGASGMGTPAPEGHDRPGGQAGATDAPRAAPAAAASDSRDAEIERLARHVATLERRLAELERGGDPAVHPKRRPERKPRK
jgi:hypothetical protein